MAGIALSQFYSVPQSTAEAANTPVSGAASSAPTTAPAVSTGMHWTVVTWFGILLALILLRVVYELSD